MVSFLRRFIYAIKPKDKQSLELAKSIRLIVGRSPGNIRLYTLAMRHSSMSVVNAQGFKESNERLEYLGDAVLGLVVAEYLFTKFPYKDEGFLTEVRARIVNREVLNRLAKKIGLKELVIFDKSYKGSLSHKSIYGDALEALIGAIYLDKGLQPTKRFIINKLINPHFDINEIVNNDTNFKSKIIEWSQKENKTIRFEISEESNKHIKQFTAVLFIDDAEISKGYGLSKKKAEQDAAHKSCEVLKIY